jgi:hypothetical protein
MDNKIKKTIVATILSILLLVVIFFIVKSVKMNKEGLFVDNNLVEVQLGQETENLGGEDVSERESKNLSTQKELEDLQLELEAALVAEELNENDLGEGSSEDISQLEDEIRIKKDEVEYMPLTNPTQ